MTPQPRNPQQPDQDPQDEEREVTEAETEEGAEDSEESTEDTGETTTTDAPTTGQGAPTTPGGAFNQGATDLVTKVFAFLGTGAGFLTFVALTGAAITWVRFSFAQLPADQAVGLVPRDDLINVGTIALMIFGLLALIAVALVYAIDSPGRATDGMRGGLSALVTVELITLILMADHGGWGRKVAAGIVMLVLGALGILLLTVTKALEPKDTSPRGVRWLWTGYRRKAPAIQPTAAELAAFTERKAVDPAAQPPKPKERSDLTPKAIVLAGVLMVISSVALGYWFQEVWVGAVALLAGALAGACLFIATSTGERFWPYGIAVFFSVVLFGAVANTAEFAADPKVSPVALIRAGNEGESGVTGLLIARTDDRYWLGHVTVLCEEASKRKGMKFARDNLVPGDEIKPGSGRIFSVPRAQVLDDEIGTWTEAPQAARRADDLLDELVKRQPPGGAQPPPEAKPAGNLLVPATPQTTTTGTTTPETESSDTTTSETTTPESGAPDGPTDTKPAPTPQPKRPPINIKAPLAVGAVSYQKCTCSRPHIEKLEPPTARRGDPVKIVGTGLGRKAVVRVDGKVTEPGRWTSESITFTARREGDVEVNCGVESNKVPLKLRKNSRPFAAFEADPLKPGSRLFTLDSSGSTDPDGDGLRRRWTIDGRPYGSKEKITYRLRGARKRARAKVKLQVFDKFKKSASATKTLRFDVSTVTLSGDQLFAPDEFKLVRTTGLKKLVERLRQHQDEISRITVNGYADFTWTEEHNQKLSERRAASVSRYLKDHLRLPPGAAVRSRGVGESKAVAKTLDDPRRAHDRRVDVTIEYSRAQSSASR